MLSKKNLVIAAAALTALAACSNEPNATEVATQGQETAPGAVYTYIHSIAVGDYDKACEAIEPSARQTMGEENCAQTLDESIRPEHRDIFALYDDRENYEERISGDRGIVSIETEHGIAEIDTVRIDGVWYVSAFLDEEDIPADVEDVVG